MRKNMLQKAVTLSSAALAVASMGCEALAGEAVPVQPPAERKAPLVQAKQTQADEVKQDKQAKKVNKARRRPASSDLGFSMPAGTLYDVIEPDQVA